METMTGRLKRGWRAVVTAAFVVLVFTVPATKGILGSYFGVNATSRNNGNNNQNNNNSNNSNQNFSSNGPPRSNPPASPIQPNGSCSTGRRHAGPHHGHNHGHYRPNGR